MDDIDDVAPVGDHLIGHRVVRGPRLHEVHEHQDRVVAALPATRPVHWTVDGHRVAAEIARQVPSERHHIGLVH